MESKRASFDQVELKDTSRVTAQWKQSPRRATSATKPAIFPATALKTTKVRRVQAEGMEGQEEGMAVDPTPNATSVVRSDILRGAAPRPHQVVSAGEEEEARLGMCTLDSS